MVVPAAPTGATGATRQDCTAVAARVGIPMSLESLGGAVATVVG
ncbi:hypothetical protein MMEU_4844 [Mycobacterium marinum str. Europe]|nr:hypothetical protein MMEU_4844 [Mycobacterium marinum str. Europe]